MAFVNQFQTADFFPQRLKSLKVFCEVPNVNEIGTVLVGPDGITITPGTGVLVPEVTVRQTPGTTIIPTSLTILPGINGKVINTLTVTVDVINAVTGAVLIAAVPISITGIVETGCELQPNDIVQKHDVEFRGGSVAPVLAGPFTGNLIITAVVELCVVIARETIVKVNAAELFCK